MRSVRKEQVLRHLLPTLAATGAAWTWSNLFLLPTWLSPSSSPIDLGILLSNGAVFLLLTSVAVNAWLLPACLVLDWVMTRRCVARPRPVLGFAISAIAVSSAPFFAAMPKARVFGHVWSSLGSSAILTAVYLATWFVVRGWFRTRHPGFAPASEATSGRTGMPQINATSYETFAIAGAALWVLGLGSISAGFETFGGEYDYRLQMITRAPHDGTQACLVEVRTPGGALGNLYSEIYLIPQSDGWTPNRRGLLVWRGRRTDVSSLEWPEDKTLRVHVGLGNDYHPRYRSFSRRGFHVNTVADSLY